MRQQGNTWDEPEPPHLLSGKQRQVCKLFRARIVVDIRVAEEEWSAAADEHVHRPPGAHSWAQADYLANVIQMIVKGPRGAAQRAIHVAAPQQHYGDQGRAVAHGFFGQSLCYAGAPHSPVILTPGVLIAGIALEAHDFAIEARLEPQAQGVHALRDYLGTTQEHRNSEAFVNDHLSCPQHSIVFAFRQRDPFARYLRRGEYRLHAGPGLIHEARHTPAIGLDIVERPSSYSAVHRSFGNRRRNALD